MRHFKDEFEALPYFTSGNLTAFNFLYHKYYQTVYSNIFKFVKNETIAEDLLQEVFVALWENRTSIKIDAPVAGWLFTVSYNKSIFFLKRRVKEYMMHLEKQKLETSIYNFSDDETIYQQRLAIIKEAVNELPPKKKEIFMLCKFENKKPEEISEELGLTVISVKDYLKQSTKLVKQYVRIKYAIEASVLFFLFF